ncbi:MAG: hypothetical protein JSS98_18210 [Bacteroidetes bacterium]|nr:hypothetical protein [Bacteroidota bacterium]MBS1920785.1 hypothetical protein [Bacteroidota bacterium]
MQKQLRIISSGRLAVCPFSSSHFPVPPVPAFIFGRHLGRRPVYYRYRGVRVFALGSSGWFVHCFPSGRRLLSALPF